MVNPKTPKEKPKETPKMPIYISSNSPTSPVTWSSVGSAKHHGRCDPPAGCLVAGLLGLGSFSGLHSGLCLTGEIMLGRTGVYFPQRCACTSSFSSCICPGKLYHQQSQRKCSQTCSSYPSLPAAIYCQGILGTIWNRKWRVALASQHHCVLGISAVWC